MDPIEQIAAAILYEGYLLWPYRRSARKNRKRWTLGGVYPKAFSEATGGDDPWLMQTQCVVVGEAPTVTANVRFLQVVERRVARNKAEGGRDLVDELQVGAERYLAWEEATEREVTADHLHLPLLETACRTPIEIPAGTLEEALTAPDGTVAGALIRRWRSLEGAVEAYAVRVQDGLFILTVKITNTTPWIAGAREAALRHTFVSTHTILSVSGGAFVSLLDPPEELKELAERCTNIKTWPVLVGEEGDRRTLLSSPIILYDYPKIAPESPGDLFDGTEIDQLLTLSILGLTDEEKEEMRASDPRARDLLARSESLTVDDFMRLHGAIRECRVPESVEKPAPQSVMVNGVEVAAGGRVRLRPRPGGDILDLALAGKVAYVEAVEQDYEDRIRLVVTLEDDPGRDLGGMSPGHRFFFAPEEVEPLDGGSVGREG